MSIYVAIVPSFNRPVAEHSNFHVPRHSLSGQSNAVETCTDASTTLSSREGFRSTVKKKKKKKRKGMPSAAHSTTRCAFISRFAKCNQCTHTKNILWPMPLASHTHTHTRSKHTLCTSSLQAIRRAGTSCCRPLPQYLKRVLTHIFEVAETIPHASRTYKDHIYQV